LRVVALPCVGPFNCEGVKVQITLRNAMNPGLSRAEKCGDLGCHVGS
jgi:hypothetical protein